MNEYVEVTLTAASDGEYTIVAGNELYQADSDDGASGFTEDAYYAERAYGSFTARITATDNYEITAVTATAGQKNLVVTEPVSGNVYTFEPDDNGTEADDENFTGYAPIVVTVTTAAVEQEPAKLPTISDLVTRLRGVKDTPGTGYETPADTTNAASPEYQDQATVSTGYQVATVNGVSAEKTINVAIKATTLRPHLGIDWEDREGNANNDPKRGFWVNYGIPATGDGWRAKSISVSSSSFGADDIDKFDWDYIDTNNYATNGYFYVYVDAEKDVDENKKVYVAVEYTTVGLEQEAEETVNYLLDLSAVTLSEIPAGTTKIFFEKEEGIAENVTFGRSVDATTSKICEWREGEYYAVNPTAEPVVTMTDPTDEAGVVFYVEAVYDGDYPTPADAPTDEKKIVPDGTATMANLTQTVKGTQILAESVTYVLHKLPVLTTDYAKITLPERCVPVADGNLKKVNVAQVVLGTWAETDYYAKKGDAIEFMLKDAASSGRTYTVKTGTGDDEESIVGTPSGKDVVFSTTVPNKATVEYTIENGVDLEFTIASKEAFEQKNITAIKIGDETKEFKAVTNKGGLATVDADIDHYEVKFTDLEYGKEVVFTVITKDDTIYSIPDAPTGSTGNVKDEDGNVLANTFKIAADTMKHDVTINDLADAKKVAISAAGGNLGAKNITFTGGVVKVGEAYYLNGEEVTFTITTNNADRKLDKDSVKYSANGVASTNGLEEISAGSYKIDEIAIKNLRAAGHDVTVIANEETEAIQVTFKQDNATDLVKTFYYYKNGTEAGDKSAQKEIPADAGELVINKAGGELAKGDVIAFKLGKNDVDFALDDTVGKNDHLYLTEIVQNGRSIVPDENGVYVTEPLTDNTTIEFVASAFNTNSITFSGLIDKSSEAPTPKTGVWVEPDAANLTQVAIPATHPTEYNYFVKRDSTYDFTIGMGSETAKNTVVTAVSYVDTDGKTVTIYPNGGVYTISSAVIYDAFCKDKTIPVTVATAAKEQEFTFTADANVSTLSITEYSVVAGSDESTPALSNPGTTRSVPLKADADGVKTGTIKVDNGKVITLNATAASGSILISDRFTVDGKELAVISDDDAAKYEGGVGDIDADPYVPGALEGKYVIFADGAHKVDVKGYKNIKVTATEASETVDGVKKTYTKTTFTDGVSGTAAKDEAIWFTVVLTSGNNDYNTKLADPTAVYGESNNIVVRKLDGDFYITKDDVEKAIKAGADITITAKATPIDMTEFTLSYKDSKLTKIYIKEGNLDEKAVSINGFKADADKVKTGKIKVQKGNKVVLTDVTYNGTDRSDVVFLKVTKDGKEVKATQYNVYNDAGEVVAVKDKWELGYVSENTTISIETAQLKLADVKINDPKEKVENTSVTGKDFAAGSKSGEYLVRGDAVLDITVNTTGKSAVKYAAGDMSYTVFGGSATKADVTYKTDGTKKTIDFWSIPYDALQEAAFSTPGTNEKKLTVDWSIVEDGYKAQALTFVNDDVAVLTLKYDDTLYGEAGVKDSKGNPLPLIPATIPYGKSVTITANSKNGFTLGTAYVIATSALDELKATSEYKTASKEGKAELEHNASKKFEAKDGVISGISISAMNEAYTVSFEEASKDEYVEVTTDVGATVVAPTAENTWNLLCNVDYAVSITKGKTPEYQVDVKSVKVDDTDLKASKLDALFNNGGTLPTGAAGFNLNSAGLTQYQGKNIVIEIQESGKKDAPKTTLTFAVSKALTAADFTVSVDGAEIPNLADNTTENVIIPVGTSKTFTIAGPDKALYEVAKGANKTNFVLETNVAKTEAKVAVQNVGLTQNDNDTNSIVISDANGARAPIRTINVRLSTEQVSKADMSSVVITPNYNYVTFDFSKTTGFDKETKGLYYHITAEAPKYNGNKYNNTAIDKYIPVKENTYVWRLADSDVFEANSVSLDVTIQLVQSTETDPLDVEEDDPDTPGDDGNIFVRSQAKAYANDKAINTLGVSNMENLNFATKIAFTPADKKAIKNIYTGQSAFVLGTVSYSIDKKTAVSAEAQQLQKVELVNANGVVVASTDGQGWYEDAISEENNTITLNPAAVSDREIGDNFGRQQLPAGKYTVVAYAVQPMGKEVKKEVKITLKQGIVALAVTTSSNSVYKASGKAASVTAKVATWYPVVNNKSTVATKKVNWVLTTADYGDNDADYAKAPEGDELFSMSGIEVTTKGVVKVAKGVTIPEEGVQFRIVAIPADYTRTDYNLNAARGIYDEIGHSEVITLTSVAKVPSKIYINNVELSSGGSIYGSDLQAGLNENDIVFTDANDEIINDVSYTIKGVGKYSNGALRVTKTGKATFNVKSTNGSSNKTVKIPFTIQNDTALKLDSLTAAGDDILEGDGKSYTATNVLANGNTLTLRVSGENNSLDTNSIKVKGGKLDKSDKDFYGNHGDLSVYVIKPTAHITTVTITEKASKAKTTLTITNEKISASKSATKIKASNLIDTAPGKTKDQKGKIFNYLNFEGDDGEEAYVAAGSYNKVTYTVSGAGDNQAILIHVTKDTVWGDFARAIARDDSLEVAEGRDFIAVTNANGAFTIDYGANGQTDIPKGTYQFTATPIDADGNAIAKTATVTVKAAPAPKAKVTLKTATFKKFGTQQVLELKKANNIAVNDDGLLQAVFADNLLGSNNKGKINKFAAKFAISANDNNTVFTLKCTDNLKDTDGYSAKKGIVGYVPVVYRQLNGEKGTTYLKVTAKNVTGAAK